MAHSVNIHFLGAAGEVTGSKFLIETNEKNILIDCGMFQGIKALRELNWKNLPVDVAHIDVVLLTHGHLDHVGYLPRLIMQGFHGKIIATYPTLDIATIVLQDSAKIHEEEAEKANREGYSKHDPALPLYTGKDVSKTLQFFTGVETGKWKYLSENIMYRFKYNGHIIGSVFIEIEIFGKRFVFSGDIGRKNDLLLYPPQKPQKADYLFLESTYGDKDHPDEDVEEIISSLVNEVLHKRGNLIIPSFAIERTQNLIYLLWKMYRKNKIPNIPVIVDSPMGTNVLQVFRNYSDWHKLTPQDYNAVLKHITLVQSYKETWEIIDDNRSKIIIAGSGMVTGGRVLTYLDQYIDNEENIVLLVGFQAQGTRGRDLQEGAKEIKFFGKYREVKARIEHIQTMSAHAGQSEILDWLTEIKEKPSKVFLIHGEEKSSNILKVKLEDIFKWNVFIPKLFENELVNL
ncbi:MBL fold metallo-hydrolase RNA specificity domain-containing protein [Abyssalbus ytuae]|uniref:MBL fold metallo-hydrolase n=1 Tax=Abyssalbus ytuae TaxID=2926907 RepID=A0A9E7CZW2_9FLAO|nr:MBL fold metallo-hydrolase [Abyssalbus ytuae]UOB17920.1 MBL fold metallo-hydrolase [Abyssalbus ytuae]